MYGDNISWGLVPHLLGSILDKDREGVGVELRLSRSGFYFSMDAFMAAIILIGGLILLTQVLVYEEPTESVDFLSKDILTSLSELKVKEVNHSIINDMIVDGTIENKNNTILNQIGELWALNRTEKAENFTGAVLESILPSRFGMSLGIEGDVFFLENNSLVQRNLVASRRMMTGVKKGETIRGSSASAYLKKASNKRTSSFAYFGGFVGQGNLTVFIRDIPADVNPSEGDIEEIILEAEIKGDFDIWMNGNYCDSISPQHQNMTPQKWDLTHCNSTIISGDNEIDLIFSGNLQDAYVSGGFVKVKYITDEPQAGLYNGSTTYYLPGIDGVINLYDGFYTPGDLKFMEIYLDYEVASGVSLPLFLDIANTTVYESNATGTVSYTISNGTLLSLLNYSFLSQKTIPVRLGFFQGNNTNTSGNITDVFTITSRTGTMDNADIGGTAETRLEAARRLNKDFVDIVLNQSGNRVGLQSYYASAPSPSPPHGHGLTNVKQDLYDIIDDWNIQNPSSSSRALCPAISNIRDKLNSVPNTRKKYAMIMTDGDIDKGCTGPHNPPNARQQAIDEVCDNYPVDGITYFTIGFGQEAASNPDVVAMLQEMANCTGGEFAMSDNITGLESIYDEFANEIAASSITYQFQRATEATNVESELFSDSYIKLGYAPVTPVPESNEISLTFQSDQFNSCNPTVNLYPQLRILDARVTSYSGDHWTSLVEANGNVAYNLSSFGLNFSTMGDPFTISIPPSHLVGGNNQLGILTGDSPGVYTSCSDNNTLIYTAAVNLSTGRSDVVGKAEGCRWFVEFESGSQTNFTVPSDYSGSKECYYNGSMISYDSDDAYDRTVYDLLSNMDFDGDGLVFVDFTSEDLEIVVNLIGEVPYLWGPSIAEVNVWE